VWPEPVQRVADFLRDTHTEVRLEEFPTGTARAKDAAQALGVELAQIVKALVCECDGRFVVVLVPGDRRADLRKVGAAVGAARARVVPAERVEAATGFPPGAVAPFALRNVSVVLLDPRLLAHDRVWVGAGSPNHLAGLSPRELVRAARARQMDVVSDDAYDSG